MHSRDLLKIMDAEAAHYDLHRVTSNDSPNTDAIVALYTKDGVVENGKRLCVSVAILGYEMLEANIISDLVKDRVKSAAIVFEQQKNKCPAKAQPRKS